MTCSGLRLSEWLVDQQLKIGDCKSFHRADNLVFIAKTCLGQHASRVSSHGHEACIIFLHTPSIVAQSPVPLHSLHYPLLGALIEHQTKYFII